MAEWTDDMTVIPQYQYFMTQADTTSLIKLQKNLPAPFTATSKRTLAP